MIELKTKFIVLMGVSGSGKTTVGEALAAKLSWAFYDADNFHPPQNIAKMRNGIPLTDEDRIPWLQSLHQLIVSSLKNNQPGILACSALKERYRQILLADCKGVILVYLKGSYDQIWSRMTNRQHHYMKPGMLKSQFDALEEPAEGLVMDTSQPVDEIVTAIIESVL